MMLFLIIQIAMTITNNNATDREYEEANAKISRLYKEQAQKQHQL